MIVLGVDPDMKTTALALADEKRVYKVGLIHQTVVDKLSLLNDRAVVLMCQEIARQLHEFVEGWTYYGAVVEGQRLSLGGNKAKATPEGLINLATVSGAAISAIFATGLQNVLRPLPSQWKGTIEKKVQQTQTCYRYGWKDYLERADYVIPQIPLDERPIGWGDLKNADSKHILDAIGMAYWGATGGFR